MAPSVEIAPRTEADLPLLFGLAKGAFVDRPGWSDERVLEVLRRDVTFVAREGSQPPATSPCAAPKAGRSSSSSCSSRPAMSAANPEPHPISRYLLPR